MKRARLFLAAVAAVLLVAAACSSDDSSSDDDGSSGADDYSTLRVPEDHATIQAAVDASEPGDLVLISPGVYKESVTVETENIVIRGLDRNEVIVDGEFERENGIIVFSNGVAVENLTVRNNTSNGLFFTGEYEADFVLTGYRASYVTAYNNGLYGIYAFNARQGRIDNSYGSGHPDSAFYIGQCDPCDAVITDVLAENNVLGYSGTNSSTNTWIVNSEWKNNRAGIVPNSLTTEKLSPQHTATIAGNVVYSNNNAETPLASGDFGVAFGNGIVVGGGNTNTVTKNLVYDHVNAGIVVTDLPEFEEFTPEGNVVEENVVEESGIADLVYVLLGPVSAEARENCFADNTFTSSAPADIETEMPCEGEPGSGWDLLGPMAQLTTSDTGIPYEEMPAPPEQENMADAETAPPEPATDISIDLDLASITTPER